MRNPGLAAVLRLVVPGIGQLYHGRGLADALRLIVMPRLWIGSGGLLSWLCHIVATCSCAREHSVRA